MNDLGRTVVVTTDSSTEGSTPGTATLSNMNGMVEFSEEAVSRQFGATFNQPKNAITVYSDDLDHDEPFRHLTDWYLIKKGKSLKQALSPLPDRSFTHLHELHGTLEPVKGLTDHPPIRVVIKDLKGWSLDRSDETRGIWVESSVAWYKLMSPSSSVGDPVTKVTMHDLHVPLRAKFHLLCNLVDLLSEDSFRYLEVHLTKTPLQIFEMLSPTSHLLCKYPDLNSMPFDFQLLRRYPSFIKHHLTKYHPSMTPSCQFMKGLDQLEEEYKDAKKKKAPWVQDPYDYMLSTMEAEKRGSRQPHGDLREGAVPPRPNKLIKILQDLHLFERSSPNNAAPVLAMWHPINPQLPLQAQPLWNGLTPPSPKSSKKVDPQLTSPSSFPESKSLSKRPTHKGPQSSLPPKKKTRNLQEIIHIDDNSEDEVYDDIVTPTARKAGSGSEVRTNKSTPKVQPNAVKSSKRRRSSFSDSDSSYEIKNGGNATQDKQLQRGSVPKKINVGSHRKSSTLESPVFSFDEPTISETSTSRQKIEGTIPNREFKLKGAAVEPLEIVFESNNIITQNIISWTKTKELKKYLDTEGESILVEKAADFVADVVQARKLSSMAVIYVSIQALQKSKAAVHRQLFNCKKSEDAAARIIFIRWFNKALRLLEDAGGKESMGSQIVIAILELMKEMKSVDCSKKLHKLSEKFEVDWMYCVDRAMALANKFQLQSVQTACYVVGAYLRLLPPNPNKELKTSTSMLANESSQTKIAPKTEEKNSSSAVSQLLAPQRSSSSIGNDTQPQDGIRRRETGVQARKQQQTRLASMLKQARVQCIGRTAEEPSSSEKKEQEEFSIGPWDPGFESLDQDDSKLYEKTYDGGWVSPSKCSNEWAGEKSNSTNRWGVNKGSGSAWGTSSLWSTSEVTMSGKNYGNTWNQGFSRDNREEYPLVNDEVVSHPYVESGVTDNIYVSNKSWNSAVDEHKTDKIKVLGGSWGTSTGWTTSKPKDSGKSMGWGQPNGDNKAKSSVYSETDHAVLEEDALEHVKNQLEMRPDPGSEASVITSTGKKTSDNAEMEVTPSSSSGWGESYGKSGVKKSSNDGTEAEKNESAERQCSTWGSSSSWNSSAAKGFEKASGGWGQPKKSDSSWGVLSKETTSCVVKRPSVQQSESSTTTDNAKTVAIEENSFHTNCLDSSDKSGDDAKWSNSTDKLKTITSESLVSAWGSTSSKTELTTNSGDWGQTRQQSTAEAESTVKSKHVSSLSWASSSNKNEAGKQSIAADERITSTVKSAGGGWGLSSCWGNSARNGSEKISSGSWGQASSRGNIGPEKSCNRSWGQGSNRGDVALEKSSSVSWGQAGSKDDNNHATLTPHNTTANVKPISSKGWAVGGGQDEAAKITRDTDKLETSFSNKPSGTWGSSSSWTSVASKSSGVASWRPTSRSNNSSKISADAARLSNSIVEAGNSNASDSLLANSASSLGSGVRVSTSAVEVRRSSSNIDNGIDADRGSRMQRMSSLREDEEDGEISEKRNMSALSSLPEKGLPHDVKRIAIAPSGVVTTNDKLVPNVTSGRGRGVDNRPSWMTNKGNESGNLDVEDRLSNSSRLILDSGKQEDFGRSRGRGRGICNLPAWQTHGDSIGNRSTSQEETPNNSLSAGLHASSSYGLSRDAAERAAQRERNREELRRDRQKYKAPRSMEMEQHGMEVVQIRRDDRYASSEGSRDFSRGDTSMDFERGYDKGRQQQQPRDSSKERLSGRSFIQDDRRLESRSRDGERFYDGKEQSKQRWR